MTRTTSLRNRVRYLKKKIVQRRIKLHNEQIGSFSDLRLILVFHEYIIFRVQWTVEGPVSLHIYLEVKSLISAVICINQLSF